MARMSKSTYNQLFDALLSQELYFNASFATEENIRSAIKRILGRMIKEGMLLMYNNLRIDDSLDVYFTITDPDHDVIDIHLIYGA